MTEEVAERASGESGGRCKLINEACAALAGSRLWGSGDLGDIEGTVCVVCGMYVMYGPAMHCTLFFWGYMCGSLYVQYVYYYRMCSVRLRLRCRCRREGREGREGASLSCSWAAVCLCVCVCACVRACLGWLSSISICIPVCDFPGLQGCRRKVIDWEGGIDRGIWYSACLPCKVIPGPGINNLVRLGGGVEVLARVSGNACAGVRGISGISWDT